MAKKYREIRPYSRLFRRGVIGDSVDGRSRLGRYLKRLEAELIAHLGGEPTIVQQMLVERAIKLRVQLDGLDQKLASGEWNDHDARTMGGCLNAYRLLLRELGLKSAADRPLTPAEALARIHGEKK